MKQHSPLDCPSAQPDMQDARVFGVVLGSAEHPQVSYLAPGLEVHPSSLPPGKVSPTEALRIAARCETSRCVHFDGQRCALAQKIVHELPEVVDGLPACSVRSSCRWYAEQGRAACLRCPQVVTLRFDQSHAGAER